MELAIATPKGNKGTVEVSEAAFGIEFNQDLIHQTVVAFLAGARQGTQSAEKSFCSFWWWPQAIPSEGHRSCTRRYYPQPNMAFWWCYLCCAASGSQSKA